jgi:hypothetical protein
MCSDLRSQSAYGIEYIDHHAAFVKGSTFRIRELWHLQDWEAVFS